MNINLRLLITMLLMFNFINKLQAVARPSAQRSSGFVKTAQKPTQAKYIATKPVTQAPRKPIAAVNLPTRQAPFPYQNRYPVQKPPVGSSNRPFVNTSTTPSPTTSVNQVNNANPSGIIVVPVYVPVPTNVTSDPNLPAPQQNQIPNSNTLPLINCPEMPSNTDNLNDVDYQKVMSNFRQEKFNTDLINTQANADKCPEQCQAEFPERCYTGFTSDNNKCECATPKK